MAEAKTKVNNASVAAYIAAIEDPQRRADCEELDAMMRAVTKTEPKMWGTSIVGYGSYHYVYASGKAGDWPLTGFAARKNDLTVYIVSGFDHFPDLMTKLGRHSCGKSCLYLKRLTDVHKPTLKKLIAASVKHMKATNPPGKI